MSSAPRHRPLIVRKRPHSPNHLVSRIQETERSARVTTDSFTNENMADERGRSVSHKEIGRPSRSSHRRGFSEDFASRRSASLNGKRAPSPLRNVATNQDKCRTLDGLQIPTGIPELDGGDLDSPFKFPSERPQTPNHDMDSQMTGCQHSRNSSVNTNKELPPLPDFLMPETLFFEPDTVGMRAALESLNLQNENRSQQIDFDVPLPDSPSSAEMVSDTDAQSPTFSSIKGGNSGISTPHRLSDPAEWPLRNEELFLNFNRSMQKLSLHARSVSTTSTAMYSLPIGCDGNPFATEKSHEAEPGMRQLSQMEQLLDEFEYLGAALL